MLKQQINDDIKTAMKARDKTALTALRMAKAGILEAEVKLGRDATDADCVAVVQSAVKSRNDSVKQYEDAGRPELAEAEKAEIEILSRYLPTPLTEAELKAAITKIIADQGLTEKRQMGQIMKELKSAHGAKVDGKLASKLAAQALS